MNRARSLFLVICFFVDVRVHAKTFSGEGYRLEVGPGGVLESTDGGWDLIHGEMLVHSEHQFKAKSPYALVLCEGSCVGILRRAEDHLVLMNLGGDWTFRPTGSTEKLRLPVGLSMRLGEVEAATGKPAAEFPLGLPWNATLKLWAHLESGGTKIFRRDVERFRPQWMESVEAASAEQTVAAHHQVQHQAELAAGVSRKRAVEDRQDAALRALFAQKTFE